MEEVSAYIESGILELYVLGQLSPQESVAVEMMAAKYSEVKSELSAIEIALEGYAFENALKTAPALDKKFLASFVTSANDLGEQPKIVPLYDANIGGKIKSLRYALVACIALLVVCAASLYALNKQLKSAQNQIAALSTEKDQFAKKVNRLEFDKAGMENRIAMTETSEWTTVKLQGVKNAPASKMLVYWNKNNKNILINYAAIDLPETDPSHEYQLWAMVDGKPISLGVFGGDEAATTAVKQMETIRNAQAFAVTIEPIGGSANPTMDKMLVMGNI